MVFLNYILLLLIGAAGGFLGNTLKVPAGTLIGSMLAVGLSKYVGILSLDPSKTLSVIVQIGIGLTLGITFATLEKKQIIKLFKGLIFITIAIYIMTFGVGYLLSHFTYLDLRTIFIGTTPGGIGEMSTLAQQINLNSPIVAIMHVIRVIIVMSIFPAILKFVYHKKQLELKGVEKSE